MKNLFGKCIVFACILFGSTTVFAATYKAIASCDSGAATLLVDERDNRRLQLVVHNRQIAEYMAGASDPHWPIERLVSSCGPWLAHIECLNENGELVYNAHSYKPVLSFHDFEWIRAGWMSGPRHASEIRFVDVGANRQGSGIKLKKFSDARQESRCDDSGDQCEYWSTPAPYHEYENWYFSKCHKMAS